tara:strand:+ start:256 stop:762 length:507 start_codon:yes stop_codon:yes gene_type:complete
MREPKTRATNRLLLIGEAPTLKYRGMPPFSGPTGARLCEVFDADFRSYADAINILSDPQRRKEKGSEYNAEKAKENARLVADYLARTPWGLFTGIVFAGKRVAATFGFEDLEYFVPGELPVRTIKGRWRWLKVWTMPHPSGVNRWWNEDCNLQKAKRWAQNVLSTTRA